MKHNFELLFEAMKVHVEASTLSKKQYSLKKSNYFYDFFGQKVIIMAKNKTMSKVDALGNKKTSKIWHNCQQKYQNVGNWELFH